MTQNKGTQEYQHLIDNGYEFKFGDYLNRGFQIFGKDPGPFIGYTALMMVIMVASVFTIIGIFIVAYPLIAGFYIYANKVANDEPRKFADFFQGFNNMGQLSMAMIVSLFLVMIGFICLIVPGIYLGVAYMFVVPLIALGRLEFWDAMETSRKVITKNWWWFLLMGIVAGIIGSMGQILLYVGMIVTMPIQYCIYYAAFEGIMGEPQSAFEEKIDEIGAEIDEIQE